MVMRSHLSQVAGGPQGSGAGKDPCHSLVTVSADCVGRSVPRGVWASLSGTEDFLAMLGGDVQSLLYARDSDILHGLTSG